MREPEGESRFRFLFWRTDFVGVAMIVSGLFFLLVNFKLIPASDFVLPRVLGILFIMVGLIFLFFSGAGRWLTWFVIPAGAFLTLGIVTLVFGWNRFFSLDSASLFSLGFGLTFLALFCIRRGHWWVLIPSGVFIGLAIGVEIGAGFPIIGWHPVAALFCPGDLLPRHLALLRAEEADAVEPPRGGDHRDASFLYLLGILLARWSILWPVVLLLAGLADSSVDRRSRSGARREETMIAACSAAHWRRGARGGNRSAAGAAAAATRRSIGADIVTN